MQVQLLLSAPTQTVETFEFQRFFLCRVIFPEYQDGGTLMAEDPTRNSVRVGARQIVEFLYRSGGLSPVTYHQLSPNAGTRTHQAFYRVIQERYLNYQPASEVTLTTRYEGQDFDLVIRGRADLILFYDDNEDIVTLDRMADTPEADFVLEVKTVSAPLASISQEGEAIHWAQVLLYTAMFYGLGEPGKAIQVQTPSDPIHYALAYVSQDTLETLLIVKTISPEDLAEWFRDCCERYLSWANIQEQFRKRRDASLKALGFPFSSLRDGQRDLMETVLQALRQRTPLLAEAPTGIGKTMATLYPALKALLAHKGEHIFYLTAKTSTRQVAEQALDALYENGLVARAVTLTAKEQICVAPKYFCDKRVCPYAVNYYDNLPAALQELLPHVKINKELLQQIARKHMVCPHELQLDISYWCDVIIGDYNHAFDPRVQLERFFGENGSSQILLVDEAHNLVDRSREMYSLTLERKEFADLHEVLKIRPGQLTHLLEEIMAYFDKLIAETTDSKPGFPAVETGTQFGPEDIAAAPDFRAIRVKTPVLRKLLASFLVQASMRLDDIDDLQVRRQLIETMASCSFALRIQDEFWDESYVVCFRKSGKEAAIRYLCLDVSNKLIESYKNKHGAVFFSATLRPLEYFRRNFAGTHGNDRPITLELPSPFPPEHLQVLIHAGIQTIYKERKNSRIPLAQSIALTAILRGGHQLCFFPSFAYMNQLLEPLLKMLKKHGVEVLVQKRSMPDHERRAFLERFRKNDGKPLLGLAVLGGIFGEGIDLVGHALETVQIISVGIPQLSPERELMKQYYDERMESGFNYAYRYPGFNKILQAAGRLIRSEDDQGTLILYDERLSRPEYLQLLPEHWEAVTIHSVTELKDHLQNPPQA